MAGADADTGPRSWELAGMTLGVFGLGGTGVEVARRAQGFGMRTLALDTEEVKKPPFVEEVWSPDRFYDLLEESDVVVICLPLTDDTTGHISMLRRLQAHAGPRTPDKRDSGGYHRRAIAARGA